MQFGAALLFKILAFLSRVSGRRIFFRLRVESRVDLRTLIGPIIITPNHKSYTDHFLFLAALPLFSKLLPVRVMAADWLFRIPRYKGGTLIKWALFWFGAYPVRKGEGLGISLRQPLRILQKGYTVAIYPEGGIQYRKGVYDVKIGAAFLAHESGAPILPVAIVGIEYLRMRNFFFGQREVVIRFGKPFRVASDADLNDVSHRIRCEIEMLYHGKRTPQAEI